MFDTVTTEDFTVSTARMGDTVRHVKSQRHYIVAGLLGGRAVVKSPRGQLGIIGDGCLDESDFLRLNFPPFDPILNG